MAGIRTAWGAAIGQAPSRDLEEARKGFSRAELRQVHRIVRAGEAAPDARQARLAVAIARDRQRTERLAGTGTMLIVVLIVVLWAGTAVGRAADGDVVLGVLFGASTVLGVWTVVAWRRGRGRAALSERRNLDVLERAGEPAEPQPAGRGALAEPNRPAFVAAVAAAFLFYVVSFGTLTTLMDDAPLTLGHVLGRGATFAILMTITNLTWMRARNRRATQRGSSP